MDTKQKQKRAANFTALLVAVVALAIYIGFYFVVYKAR